MHTEQGDIRIQLVAIGHAESGDGHDEHTDRHGGQRGPLFHELGHQVDRQHDHKRIDIRVPGGRGVLARQSEHIFGHGGVELVLYHPESRDDDDQGDQPSVGADLDERVPDLPEALALAGMLVALVEEPDGKQGEEGHGGREVVERDESLVAQGLTERFHDCLAREGADIHHGVEDGEAFRPGLGCGLFRYRTRYDTLDKGTATDDQGHDGQDAVACPALEQSGEGGCRAVAYQPGGLKPGGIDGQAEITAGQKGKGQQHGAPETDLVGQRPSEGRQEIEAGREDSGDAGRLQVVEPQYAAQVERDDDEDTIIGGPLEQLDGVGYPKGLTELDFFLLFCLLFHEHYDIIII